MRTAIWARLRGLYPYVIWTSLGILWQGDAIRALQESTPKPLPQALQRREPLRDVPQKKHLPKPFIKYCFESACGDTQRLPPT